MNTYLWVAGVILVVGVVAGFISFLKKKETPELISKQGENKQASMEKIRDYFERLHEATNDDIQRVTGVSDATATRYLEEIERAGEIRQVGTSGKSVKYERVA